MSLKTIAAPSRKYGVFMFCILIFAYIIFAVNWVAGSNLSKEITDYYFNGENVSPIISEVVNYTITIARIVANLLAAYVLLKLHPRKAVVFALFCLCFSFFAIFSSNYWLYTISRMIMALGGSMIMIFVNTYVAKFIPKSKKILTSTIITASYNIGAAQVAVLFLVFKNEFIKDWRHTMIEFSFLSLVVFGIWLIVARDFEPNVSWEHPNYFVYKLLAEANEYADVKEEKRYTYKDAFRDKFIYCFSFGFGGFLFLYVMPIVSLPRVIAQHISNSNFKPEFMILSVTLGGILGTIVSIFVTRRDFRRKPFLLAHGVLMIGLMAIGIYVVQFNEMIAYIMFTLAGMTMYSQYPIYLNYPYEMPNMNSQKLTILFGVFWAFGYGIYTVFNFVWSLVLNHMGYVSSIAFYLIASSIYIVFVTMLPETRKKRKA